MNREMFAELFGGKTRFRALHCLFENPGRDFGVRELAELAEMDPGNLTRLIKRWEAVGLVNAINDRGIRYKAAADPSLTPLITMFRQSGQLVEDLKEFFAQLPEVKVALIFGSYARSEMKAESDVDVLVLGDISELKLNAQLKPLGREFGRPINVSVYTLDEFQVRRKSDDPVICGICADTPILLKGDNPCR